MKAYEGVVRHTLMRRCPVILRVDGRAFHTFTRNRFERPWSPAFSEAMAEGAKALMEEVQGAKLAYVQSDEASVLITDYDTLQTDAWFGYNIQKMVSIASCVMCHSFNQYLRICGYLSVDEPWPMFDARVFNVPHDDVTNYFVWRQKDASRNSVSMLARAYYSHGDLKGVSCNEMQNMLMLEKGVNWNDMPTAQKRGFCIRRTEGGYLLDREVPIFTQDRDYIERYVFNPAAITAPSRLGEGAAVSGRD